MVADPAGAATASSALESNLFASMLEEHMVKKDVAHIVSLESLMDIYSLDDSRKYEPSKYAKFVSSKNPSIRFNDSECRKECRKKGLSLDKEKSLLLLSYLMNSIKALSNQLGTENIDEIKPHILGYSIAHDRIYSVIDGGGHNRPLYLPFTEEAINLLQEPAGYLLK